MVVFFRLILCWVVCSVQLMASEFQGHVLITGGAGFVGRHFTHRLCAKGWLVTIVDSLISESALHPTRWPSHLQCTAGQQLIFIEQDCREFFKSTASQTKWDLFIHLAAVDGDRVHVEGSPLQVAIDDLSIDSAAFQWAADKSTKLSLSKMVYFSAGAIYPDTEEMSDRRDVGYSSDSSYGWSKRTGEYLAHIARQTYGLNVSVYRPMTGYGEDQHETSPFIAMLKKAMARENPVHLWSNSARDFVYIEDIVTCVLDIESRDNNPAVVDGTPLKLATGISTSFKDLVKLMASHFSYDPDIVVVDDMAQGVQYLVGDVTLSNSHGCRMTTSLGEGIERAIKYLSHESKNNQTRSSSSLSSSKSDMNRKNDHHGPDNRENEPIYSSFHCIGGSQTFSNWTTLVNNDCIALAIQDWQHICRFEDVCWINHEFVFYEDASRSNQVIPEYLKISSFQGRTSIRSGQKRDRQTEWKPRVLNSSMPRNVPYDDDKAYLFVESSYADNFGHLLHDDLFPALTAMRLYNVDASRGQLLHNGCQRLEGINPYQCDYCADPYLKETCTGCKTRTETCNENYQKYGKLVLGHEPINLFEKWFGSNFCMKTLIVGQSQPLSLHYLDYQRSSSIRQGRDNILRNLGLEFTSTKSVANLTILVLMTGRGINRGKKGKGWFKMDWPTLCDDVRELIGNLSTIPVVKCVDPSSQSILAQVIDAQEASIIVAEHGTLSYSALYARDGTILITIGSELHLKEPHVLPFITYLHVFYMVYERKNDLEGLVHHAFQLLVKKRLFNMVYDTADKTYKHRQDVVKQCTKQTIYPLLSESTTTSSSLISNEPYELSDRTISASASFESYFNDDGTPIGHYYNVTLMYGGKESDNGSASIRQSDTIQMDFLYGESVHTKMMQTFPDYRSSPRTVYVDFSYRVSEQLYGVYYTPTLPAATTQDYQCTQLDMMKNVASLAKSHTYLEFSSDRTIIFDKVSPLFDHSVHNDLTHAHVHDMTTDGRYNIIYIGRLYDARVAFQYVKAALQILAPSGVIIIQDCLPGHKLHASFPRESGSSIWYGTTWKVLPILRLDKNLDVRVADVDTGLGVITPRLNAHVYQTFGMWHPYDLSVTWQDLLNSAPDPFDALTWDHYELYRHELMNIVGLHEIFFGPPPGVDIPETFDFSSAEDA